MWCNNARIGSFHRLKSAGKQECPKEATVAKKEGGDRGNEDKGEELVEAE